jgi:hypothetical protein
VAIKKTLDTGFVVLQLDPRQRRAIPASPLLQHLRNYNLKSREKRIPDELLVWLPWLIGDSTRPSQVGHMHGSTHGLEWELLLVSLGRELWELKKRKPYVKEARCYLVILSYIMHFKVQFEAWLILNLVRGHIWVYKWLLKVNSSKGKVLGRSQ